MANTTLCTDICVGVAVDRFANFGAFVAKVVGDGQSLVAASKVWPHSNTAYQVIMSMRVYAMYLGSKLVLGVLVAMILVRIGLGLAISVVIFGPQSGISGPFFFFLFFARPLIYPARVH